MNDDLISRQAAIDALAVYIHNVDKVYSTGLMSANDCKDAAHSVLDDLPAAQSDSKPCYWMVKEGTTAFWDVCSNCGEKTIHRMPHFKYCPYCGRRMEA